MKIPKTVVDPVLWAEATSKLLSNELTRQQAADHCGLVYSTFIKHLKYAGLDKTVKASVDHPNKGDNSPHVRADPDRHERYKQAVAHALKTHSVRNAATIHNVNYQVLARKVRDAKAQTPT